MALMETAGTLVYSAGGGDIEGLAIGAGQGGRLYESPHSVATIGHLSKLGPGAIVFDECPVIGECVLKSLTLRDRTVATLRTGKMPTVIAGSEHLFFYDVHPSGTGKALFIGNVRAPASARAIARPRKPRRLPNGIELPLAHPVVEISDHEVLFLGETGNLLLYDVTGPTLRSLGRTNCVPQVWRSAAKKLICSDWESGGTYQMDVTTMQADELPALKRAHGFVYVPHEDVLIFGRSRVERGVREISDILTYNFASGLVRELRPRTHIASGAWFSGL